LVILLSWPRWSPLGMVVVDSFQTFNYPFHSSSVSYEVTESRAVVASKCINSRPGISSISWSMNVWSCFPSSSNAAL
jgi:hypothetical protein